MGYRTKLDEVFGFLRRNVNFTRAAKPGFLDIIDVGYASLIGGILPVLARMVRVPSITPSNRNPVDLPLYERYIDVPACCIMRVKM